MRKNKKENLSRIAADFLLKAKTGEIGLFRDEILRMLDASDEVLGKFRSLLESFRNIIPDEKHRYDAIFKAMSTTSGLDRTDVLRSAENQLEELKSLEKEFMSILPEWQNELKEMESRAGGLEDEISGLHERIGRLEREKKEIEKGISAREEGIKAAGEKIKDLFSEIASDITAIKKTIEDHASEKVQPIVVKIDKHEEKTRKSEPAVPRQVSSAEDLQLNENMKELEQASAPKEGERVCPMCGGRMNFFLKEKKWLCYVCAYEETGTGDFQAKTEGASAPEPAPAAESTSPPKPILGSQPIPPPEPLPDAYSTSHSVYSSSSSAQPSSGKKKNCPVCKKKMEWFENEKKWSCTSCGYERMEF